MIRKILHDTQAGHSNHPLRKNHEIQRIETFSDGVFALAVTLLIVSLEVPKSFEDLMINIRGFFAFGASFLLLVFIWNEQHIFFRRYGLEDTVTYVLNIALLFIVLFYVYPLKFLFTVLFSGEIYGPGASPVKIMDTQIPRLMEIYALGYLAIYCLFFLMYLRALRQAGSLELSAVEVFECRTSLFKQLIMIIVGCIAFSLATAVPPRLLWIAGFSYMIIGPALTILYSVRKRMQKKI
jgi:uncharacterized membrane protein